MLKHIWGFKRGTSLHIHDGPDIASFLSLNSDAKVVGSIPGTALMFLGKHYIGTNPACWVSTKWAPILQV